MNVVQQATVYRIKEQSKMVILFKPLLVYLNPLFNWEQIPFYNHHCEV
jgi:hypothetical protein